MSTTLLATWEKPGKVAIDAAWKARAGGADLRTTLEQGLSAAELDPSLVAIGLGSLPNTDGELELDASIMDGRDLASGAVCGVRGIVPVISVARKVMEESPAMMIAGEQARRFALEKGFLPKNLMTPSNIERYDQWRSRPVQPEDDYVHSVEDEEYEHLGDTVTVLGLEPPGHVVAASATSGLAWKIPGRVGDSPIVGAGIYADDETGCAGATGFGEQLWKASASFRTVSAMERGLSAQEACEETIRWMIRKLPRSLEMPCVVLALRNDGDFGAANTVGEFPMWICRDGEMELRRYPGLAGEPRK
ncbi:MAG TPA: N(4)-(beta-N-acetylglucosaminyl)-L-asparaginase [Fimbriimonadaceae bacterium]|nr:N(4)-(beta-N-acetylglucosaminyl)-L-asparaginase [Fimbriimonadaceae bacterium]